MDRKDVDEALARLRDERRRVTDALLELEANWGYRLLDGTRLSGATERCWEELQGTTTTLWTLLGAYEQVLTDAERLRAQKARPGHEELAELARLLSGRSVELVPADAPLERRSLLGPAGERLTLAEVVARMTPLYEEAAQTVAALDAACSALLSRLTELENAAREVAAMLDTLGLLGPAGSGDAEFDRLNRELAEIREAVRADPLSFVPGDPVPAAGGPDMTRLDRLADGLSALRTRSAQAVRIRAEHDERVRRIDAAIGRVAAAEAAARAARDVVLVKISSADLPDLPAVATALRDRLTALGPLREEGRWLELAGPAEELEKAAADALMQARTTAETISGLLEHRNELRGRLQAYKARAGRLGRAEDAELGRLYRQAHELLWTAPCDLRGAAAAVARYQRAVRGEGDD